jgi:hypothetical protein
MNSYLLLFIRQFMGVVLAAILPVILTAFLWIPYALGGHPGEARSASPAVSLHMT